MGFEPKNRRISKTLAIVSTLISNKNPINFSLIQASLGNLTIPDYSLQTESLKVLQTGKRISKCCVEWILASDKNTARGIYRALVNAITLTKCLEADLWENSKFVTKQVEMVGNVESGLLGNGGFNSWGKILAADAGDLERVSILKA
jgi:ATP-dependent DNA helicase HFM1/MER3